MTVRYVDGTSGNDAWDGLSAVWSAWLNGPKKTLNGAEDTPVTPGDLVHVRSGVYREALQADVNGTAGNAIEYRGDYAGVIWPGGGVVRITGSNDDLTATRANSIVSGAKHYRTWIGFQLDMCSSFVINQNTGCTNHTIAECHISVNTTSQGAIYLGGAGQAACTIRDCFIHQEHRGSHGIAFTHTALVDNCGHVIEKCIFAGSPGGTAISTTRIGGISVRNCVIKSPIIGVNVTAALTPGQTLTVNNCVVEGCTNAVTAAVLGDLVEDYNSLYNNNSDRANVAVGAHSVSYPPLFDSRWFFEMVGGGKLVTPFDLSAWSQLINVAGAAPPATDMRGTAVIGAQREFGALEYDPALLIAGGAGAVRISPHRGGLG